MKEEIKHDTSEINALFIHSAIDDAGLNVHEFRIVCHIARRAGKGEAFPSASSMAQICRMKRNTVFRTLKALQERNIVIKKNRKGKCSIYVITKPSQWRQPVPFGETGGSPVWGDGSPKGVVPFGDTGVVPFGDTGVVPFGDTRRISTEGDLTKEIQLNPHKSPFLGNSKKSKYKPSRVSQRILPDCPHLQKLSLAYSPTMQGKVSPDVARRYSDLQPDPSDIEIIADYVTAYRTHPNKEAHDVLKYCSRTLDVCLGSKYEAQLQRAHEWKNRRKKIGDPDYYDVGDKF